MEPDGRPPVQRWMPTTLMRFVVVLVVISTSVALFIYLRQGSAAIAIAAFLATCVVMQVAYFATILFYTHLQRRRGRPTKAEMSTPAEVTRLIRGGR